MSFIQTAWSPGRSHRSRRPSSGTRSVLLRPVARRSGVSASATRSTQAPTSDRHDPRTPFAPVEKHLGEADGEHANDREADPGAHDTASTLDSRIRVLARELRKRLERQLVPDRLLEADARGAIECSGNAVAQRRVLAQQFGLDGLQAGGALIHRQGLDVVVDMCPDVLLVGAEQPSPRRDLQVERRWLLRRPQHELPRGPAHSIRMAR